jgi:hypothetical protein
VSANVKDIKRAVKAAEPEKPKPDALILRDHFRIIVNGVGRVWERNALVTDPEAIQIILANDDLGIARKFREIT